MISITLDQAIDFFAKHGNSDVNYLKAHFNRYAKTKEFCFSKQFSLGGTLKICDIGAHWLHNTYFYASEGHKCFCLDLPNTLRELSVISAANELKASLIICHHIDRGDGLLELEESSVDIVLMCEVLEHFTFNPIIYFKEIYRILKPGGRIIITTPNVNYFKKLQNQFERIQTGSGVGIEVASILRDGTHGHHWKEWSFAEIRELFELLTPDFVICAHKFISLYDYEPAPLNFPFVAIGTEINFDNLFVMVELTTKENPISITPPWTPIYE